MKSKFAYFPCRKGGLHEGELLNYVCIQKGCKERGLLCSICKQNHPQHQTIPLKLLLQNLHDSQLCNQKVEGVTNYLEKLEEQKVLMLYQLKVSIESMAEIIRKFQEEIEKEYEKARVDLLEEVQTSEKVRELVAEALENKVQNENAFIKDFSRIISMVEKEKDKIKLNLNIESLLQSYSKKQYQKKQKLILLEKNLSQQLLSKTIQQSEASFLNPLFDDIQMQKKQTSNKLESLYSFSPSHKAPSITLQNNNKVARQNQASNSRFVFVDKFVGGKFQKISFRVKKLANWIGVGIGIRSIIANGKYNFNYQKTGHGSYLISNNKFSWSHSESSQNVKNVTFGFGQNDIIDITLTPKELLFLNRKDKTSYKLTLTLKQKQWENVCFCANLCSPGDQVQIVSSK